LLLAARRRARESDANLSLAAESGNVGLWQLATGSDRVNASLKFRSLFGFPPSGRITVEDILDHIHPDDRSDTEKSIQNALNDVKDFSVEHRMVLPDVGLRWIVSTGHAEIPRQGRPARVRGASIDITAIRKAEIERQALRTELAHLSRVSTMGQISSVLAHELTQPLGAILRNAEAAELLLAQEPMDWDELKAIVKDIQQDDQRAVLVIDRMRSFLKKHQLQIEPVSLDRVVHLVIGLLKSELQFRHVHLAVELESGLPWVRGDEIHLQQVMLNLLVNALDAIRDVPSERWRVAVRAKRLESNQVEIAVCDRGIGIPEERLQRVFEPFVSTKANGMGMGLAICRSIVETHGGRLWAENNPEGGVTVRFTLTALQEAIQK
jgi:two-component system sensor kinase FixL